MNTTYPTRPLIALGAALLFIIIFSGTVSSQISDTDREIAIGMLGLTKEAIKRNYYDPTFHGVDVDFVFEQARERMRTAPTRDALMMTIASAVLALDDSHTTFLPPPRAAQFQYEWTVRMVGDECIVSQVKPRSEAEARGLKVGDTLVAIDGFTPNRRNLWRMYYRYFGIAPASKVAMTVLSPGDAKPHVIEIPTKITPTSGVITLRSLYERGVVKKGWYDTGKVSEFEEVGKDLLIWRMHTFSQSESNIDRAISMARGHKALILDLRENGGGSVDILKRVVGSLFEKEIKIGEEKTRKSTKPLVAKSRGADVFKGDLIVLVGHTSASASEVLARVVQLEKRGKVIGDKTAGAVMESKFHELQTGIGNVLYFGASVTVADLLMADGKSLEKQGVTPDEIVLPTAVDIANSRDPVLSYAANQLGVKLSPEAAGKYFPFEWPK